MNSILVNLLHDLKKQTEDDIVAGMGQPVMSFTLQPVSWSYKPNLYKNRITGLEANQRPPILFINPQT